MELKYSMTLLSGAMSKVAVPMRQGHHGPPTELLAVVRAHDLR